MHKRRVAPGRTRWLLCLSTVLSGLFGAAINVGVDASAGASSTAATPNQAFDLSGWNLTLPIDAMGGTGGTNGSEYAAETISASQLVGGFTDAYFKLNSSKHLVFTAPSNGATSTPGQGSNHTRSELHEIYTGTGATSNNYWPSTLGGTLQAKAYVNAASADSDESTIGQIHGQGSATFVLLMYAAAKKEVLLKVYGSPTSSTMATETVVEKNVPLNVALTYVLSLENGVITATVNGTTISVTAGSGWDGFPVRFALGAYSAAPNTGNPSGDKTEVTYDSFTVSH
jgi:hypothetical protein